MTAAGQHERSALILALAYERHRSAQRDRTFGHVKAQKILHLVEVAANFDLGRAPIRDAAGPNDFQHMLAVERWAAEGERFEFVKNGSGYSFKTLQGYDKLLALAGEIDPLTRPRIEKIIDLFIPMDMGAAEVFATFTQPGIILSSKGIGRATTISSEALGKTGIRRS